MIHLNTRQYMLHTTFITNIIVILCEFKIDECTHFFKNSLLLTKFAFVLSKRKKSGLDIIAFP